jgi:hypothetical protein
MACARSPAWEVRCLYAASRETLLAFRQPVSVLSSRPQRRENFFPSRNLRRGVEGSRGCVPHGAAPGSSPQAGRRNKPAATGPSFRRARHPIHLLQAAEVTSGNATRDTIREELPVAASRGMAPRDSSTPRQRFLVASKRQRRSGRNDRVRKFVPGQPNYKILILIS